MLTEQGITPVFEMINGTDMPRFLVQNIAQAQEMLEAVNHPALKMQYDCYHMAMMGEDVLAGLHIFNLQIVHIDMNLIQVVLSTSLFSIGYFRVTTKATLGLNIDQKTNQINHLDGKKSTSPMM